VLQADKKRLQKNLQAADNSDDDSDRSGSDEDEDDSGSCLRIGELTDLDAGRLLTYTDPHPNKTCETISMLLNGTTLPENCSLEGNAKAECSLAGQKSGSIALEMKGDAYVKINLDATKLKVPPTGKIFEYTIAMDIQINDLQTMSEGLSLFQPSWPHQQDSDILHLGAKELSTFLTTETSAPASKQHGLKQQKWHRLTIVVDRESIAIYVDAKLLEPIIDRGSGDSKGDPRRDGDPRGKGGQRWRDKGERPKKAKAAPTEEEDEWAIDPKGFLLFASTETRHMPGGIKIKWLEFSTKPLTSLEVNSRRTRGPKLNTRELSELELKRKMMDKLSLRRAPYAMRKAYPVWVDSGFLATFCDPYLHGTGLDGGDVGQSIRLMNLTLHRMLHPPKPGARPWIQDFWGTKVVSNTAVVNPVAAARPQLPLSLLNEVAAVFSAAEPLLRRFHKMQKVSGLQV
jgi:hypothetical protein